MPTTFCCFAGCREPHRERSYTVAGVRMPPHPLNLVTAENIHLMTAWMESQSSLDPVAVSKTINQNLRVGQRLCSQHCPDAFGNLLSGRSVAKVVGRSDIVYGKVGAPE